MIRRRLPMLLAVVTVLSLAFAAPVLAQAPEGGEEGTVASVEGTVLESDTGALLVRTDDGDMRFVIRDTEHNPQYLSPGTRVRIWYRGTTETEFRATRIALPEEVSMEPAADEESAESAMEPTATSEESETATTREREMTSAEEARASQERERAAQENLPETAGVLPLAAAIGLGALAGGLGLRATRRRS